MKRQISSLLIASTVLAGSAFAPIALNEVSAKTVQHQQQKVVKGSFNVDGKAKAISVTNLNNHKLYSAEQLSKLLSATLKYNSKTKKYEVTKKVNNKAVKVTFTANSSTAVINGKKTKVAVAPKLVGKKLFVDAGSLVKALGGDLVGNFVATKGLVSGDTFNPQWVNNSTILVGNEDEAGSRSLLLNTASKIGVSVTGTDLVVSPNGKQAIYSDETGYVHLVDLSTKKVKDLNVTDDAMKAEFVWSNDGQKVYFLEGDKTDKVASINVADGAITIIPSDSLGYKSDLHLSVDGTKLLYVVAKEAVTTNDQNTGEVSNIDVTGTEPQIYVLDLTAPTPTPVAVTTTTDNKVFPGFLANGNIVYVSADPDTDNLPELKMVDENGTVTALVSNKDIISSEVTSNGDVMILVAESNGYSVIYKVNPTTKKLTKVAYTKLKLNSFSISNDEKSIAATTSGVNGDAVVILKNGVFEVLTK